MIIAQSIYIKFEECWTNNKSRVNIVQDRRTMDKSEMGTVCKQFQSGMTIQTAISCTQSPCETI